MDDELLLTDSEVRDIVSRWFPMSHDSFTLAYKSDIKEVARDFGFHIASAQLSKVRKMQSC